MYFSLNFSRLKLLIKSKQKVRVRKYEWILTYILISSIIDIQLESSNLHNLEKIAEFNEDVYVLYEPSSTEIFSLTFVS